MASTEEERILRAAKTHGKDVRKLSKNLKISAWKIREVLGIEGPEQRAICGGVRVNGQMVVGHQPKISPVQEALLRLTENMFFPVDQLAKRLGVSEETLRRHCRSMTDHKMGCMRYVDLDDRGWTLCAMNPETAKRFE